MSLSGININAGTMGGINTDVNYINASGEFNWCINQCFND